MEEEGHDYDGSGDRMPMKEGDRDDGFDDRTESRQARFQTQSNLTLSAILTLFLPEIFRHTDVRTHDGKPVLGISILRISILIPANSQIERKTIHVVLAVHVVLVQEASRSGLSLLGCRRTGVRTHDGKPVLGSSILRISILIPANSQIERKTIHVVLAVHVVSVQEASRSGLSLLGCRRTDVRRHDGKPVLGSSILRISILIPANSQIERKTIHMVLAVHVVSVQEASRSGLK
ncbi:hypothetical protein TRIUR3_31189 [Triticum urartu]|uniref:Uncharacterized protein n=1 Tax=Triticum urartu TaxID=4572 RepID=M7ZC59_TRIUA|nr:hypothetical protein TRIUR3_31189 [Triticum urartu]